MVKRGWKVYRNGWPDFLVIRETRHKQVQALAIEFKAKGDQMRPAQVEMHGALKTVGLPVHVLKGDWKPALNKARDDFFDVPSLQAMEANIKHERKMIDMMETNLKRLESQFEDATILFEPFDADKLFGDERAT